MRIHQTDPQFEQPTRVAVIDVERYGFGMELVAVGRTAEVFGLDSDRVLKLDRVEWNGVSHFEAGVLRAAHAAGLPVPEVFEAVTVAGRHGIVLERIRGTSLTEFLASDAEIDKCAEQFIDLH